MTFCLRFWGLFYFSGLNPGGGDLPGFDTSRKATAPNQDIKMQEIIGWQCN
jgi:hypothetical protein